ncbi:Anaphase-promoting complex- subunit 15/MND2 [Apiospora phragmitis]|uniref:Anaphase-promoting complex- subunit 15/MND2 n=1 Tax=Apiospora phragmitis TaxID=2905665 RepID=A0ABR1WUY4_9PEZI
MLSLLPDLAPGDSHSLWYNSSRNPNAAAYDPSHQENTQLNPHNQNQRRNVQVIERSPLARLRADEQLLDRRLHNISNFGSTWLKPPGIAKTLHQMREERREQEEHQEALRREQLAQELAEAEAAGAGPIDGVLEDQAQDGMDDVQLDGAHDLDEDIPEAEEADFGLSGDDEDEEDPDDESDDDDEDDPDDTADDPEQRTARAQQALMAQRMQQAADPFRGHAANTSQGNSFYGGEDEVDDEDQAHMIEEEDLDCEGGDMDMEANLDDDIPDAESSMGYEHTDTEASVTTSDNDEPAEHCDQRLVINGRKQHAAGKLAAAGTANGPLRNLVKTLSESTFVFISPLDRMKEDTL